MAGILRRKKGLKKRFRPYFSRVEKVCLFKPYFVMSEERIVSAGHEKQGAVALSAIDCNLLYKPLQSLR
jgi:hypothetical protein